jgi:hypothetical protein
MRIRQAFPGWFDAILPFATLATVHLSASYKCIYIGKRSNRAVFVLLAGLYVAQRDRLGIAIARLKANRTSLLLAHHDWAKLRGHGHLDSRLPCAWRSSQVRNVSPLSSIHGSHTARAGGRSIQGKKRPGKGHPGKNHPGWTAGRSVRAGPSPPASAPAGVSPPIQM